MSEKNKKFPKFLIGKNKMVNDLEYIVHTRDPVFFAEIIKDQDGRVTLFKLDREVQVPLKKRMEEWHFAHRNFKDKDKAPN